MKKSQKCHQNTPSCETAGPLSVNAVRVRGDAGPFLAKDRTRFEPQPTPPRKVSQTGPLSHRALVTLNIL